MASDNFTPPPPPVGVIESLTTGFEVVSSHLYLLVIPLLIDLFLWVGPRISYKQAFSIFTSSDEILKALQAYRQLLYPLFPVQYFHLLSSDHYLPLLVMPSVMAIRDAKPLPAPFDFQPPTVNIFDLSGIVLTGLVAFQIGFFTLIPYLALIAYSVGGKALPFGRIVRQILSVMAQAAVIEMIVAAFSCMLLFVFLLIGDVILALLGTDAVGLVFIFGITILAFSFTVGVLLSFTFHSMFMNSRNIVASMWDSVRVVQWNMPGTLLLFVIIIVIYWGMQYIWRLADPGSWVALAAIVGNAFISTGLVTATFVYFKDRHRYWIEFREQLIAELERRRVLQEQGNDKKA